MCQMSMCLFRPHISGISKPVVWGTRGLHPGFSWFRHFRGFRDFRESSTQLLVCSCLRRLRRFRRFRDSRRFRERRPAPKPWVWQTIGLEIPEYSPINPWKIPAFRPCARHSGSQILQSNLDWERLNGLARPSTSKSRTQSSSACVIRLFVREAPDTFNFLRHVMRAIWSARPKCSHRCVSLTEAPSKPVQIVKHTTFYSAEQTAMRTKWFKHIAI